MQKHKMLQPLSKIWANNGHLRRGNTNKAYWQACLSQTCRKLGALLYVLMFLCHKRNMLLKRQSCLKLSTKLAPKGRATLITWSLPKGFQLQACLQKAGTTLYHAYNQVISLVRRTLTIDLTSTTSLPRKGCCNLVLSLYRKVSWRNSWCFSR